MRILADGHFQTLCAVVLIFVGAVLVWSACADAKELKGFDRE